MAWSNSTPHFCEKPKASQPQQPQSPIVILGHHSPHSWITLTTHFPTPTLLLMRWLEGLHERMLRLVASETCLVWWPLPLGCSTLLAWPCNCPAPLQVLPINNLPGCLLRTPRISPGPLCSPSLASGHQPSRTQGLSIKEKMTPVLHSVPTSL